ncbi:potassium channel subfamily K member 18-like [Anthonomus grandis grandis]|uniref:potassium channel subfamily K member 18-like n=1 Tax=Anthonomus grandis grandis TaxID=2921223 RepID=UPI002166BE5E|nr:potassium channel subfamily K member 18-like [Anthonomus grandis grandis]
MMRDQDSLSAFPEYQNTYLRRASPPGSPSTRKCCYEQKDLYLKDQPSFFCCCYSCPGPRSTSILATLGVCCLVLGYTIIGAFTFMALEGDLYQDTAVAASKTNPKSDTNIIGTLREETVSRLWSITEDLNILYKENWTKLAAEEVLVFQDALFKALKSSEHSYSAQVSAYQQNNSHKWSFSSSFLYSLTLITTIGYGSISPRTPWGKIMTIIYALIGIPLMLLYLSTTGDVLARSFRRLYGKICKRRPSNVDHKSELQHQQQRCPCTNNVRVPVTLCLVIVLAYICSGAMLFNRLENWSLLDGSYFCFTSLGTIGFGDLLPGEKTEEISLCACSAYILTGMALVAMCFSLVQDQVIALLRYLGSSCSKPLHVNHQQKDDEILSSVLPDS